MVRLGNVCVGGWVSEYGLTHIRRRDGIFVGVWKIKRKDEDGDWMGWVSVSV